MKSHDTYFNEAAQQARLATCERRRCGSIIVSASGGVIGRGFNSPPAGLESQRRCKASKSDLDQKVTDKTCCVHAEQRAIMDALANRCSDLEGSTLYFAAVDQEGKMLYSGEPYCTVCSKMALDTGVGYFALWQEQGPGIYEIGQYNLLSYQYAG